MPENIRFTTNRGEIVEIGDEYEDIGPLDVDESEFFPTELPQECMEADDEPSAVDIAARELAEAQPPLTEPAYDYVTPTD